ncbi:MAG: hypothetical protein V9E88_19560 [Ferruginibacter sp.]
MKKIILLLLCFISTLAVFAQNNNSSGYSIPDLNKVKHLLPGAEIKPPVKDIKKLSLIPSRPPSRAELVSGIQQSIVQIKKGIPKPEVAAIENSVSSLPVETIHQKAIADFYADDEKKAILLMMELAAKQPDSLLVLNNLGAMLNKEGAEHKAASILMYCQDKLPNSSIVLNNLGQSFMALGDLFKAADYFNQCLSIDSLNIEANHSMGMLHYFKKEYDAAMKYFEREMSVAMRRSTMAMAYKMGKKFNLRELARRKNARSGRPEKNHFEEITMGKFSLPQFPTKTQELISRKGEWMSYAASIQAEQLFWLNNSTQVSLKYSESYGKQHPGLYSDLAQAMLDELSEEFTPEYLTNFSEMDATYLKELVALATAEINGVVCAQAPAGSSLEVQEAFAVQCCEEQRRPKADKLLSDIADRFEPLFKVGQQRWKSYINQLVAIAQLDPGAGNQMLVYNAVSGYFNYLALGTFFAGNAELNNLLVDCRADYKQIDLDSLVQSNRDWMVGCPPWLNVEVDFDGMVIKADCNKYVIEAGSSIMGAFEHEFKSGKSTLLLGPGAKFKFLGLTSEYKSQLMLVFDGNKSLSDFGVKTTAEIGASGTPLPIGGIKIGGNAAGIEISNTMTINGGYEHSLEKKGLLAL